MMLTEKLAAIRKKKTGAPSLPGIPPVAPVTTFAPPSPPASSLPESPSQTFSFPSNWKVPDSPAKQKELEMWRVWKEGGQRPEDMRPLLQSLQPLIHSHVRKYTGVQIHPVVLEAEATTKVIHSLSKFDPTRAQISTLLNSELRGLHRFVVNNQDLARITENRSRMVGDYNRAVSSLQERLEREPTAQEIADEMKIDVDTATKLSQEIRPDRIAQLYGEKDPFNEESPAYREALHLVRYDLTPQELLLFEYLTGTGGKTQITEPGRLAKKLGWSGSKVAQTKKTIADKLKEYLDVL